MIYLNGNNLVISDVIQYTPAQAMEGIKEFRKMHQHVKGLENRTDLSFLNEWSVCAICYRWGIMKERAKDADMQLNIEPEVNIIYYILGPIARFFLKLCKK